MASACSSCQLACHIPPPKCLKLQANTIRNYEHKGQNSIVLLGAIGKAWMRDPNTVAAIVTALRQVHGDDLARVMLSDGLSLAALIDALLRPPLNATRSN